MPLLVLPLHTVTGATVQLVLKLAIATDDDAKTCYWWCYIGAHKLHSITETRGNSLVLKFAAGGAIMVLMLAQTYHQWHHTSAKIPQLLHTARCYIIQATVT